MHAEFVVNYLPSRNEVKQFSSIDATVVRLVAALSGWPPNGMMLAAVIVPAVCSPASSCSTAALQHPAARDQTDQVGVSFPSPANTQ